MLRILAALALLLLLLASGCESWRANNASQTYDVNPFAVGSGDSVFTPVGSSDDMRRGR